MYQRRKHLALHNMRWYVVGLLIFACLGPKVLCHTEQSEVQNLLRIREANVNRSKNWQKAFSTWTCPTDPADSEELCDPCSRDWSGNWEHVHCRGSNGGYGEGSKGNYDGYISNIHVTDQGLDGPPAKEWCLLSHLRELDLDGGNQNGPFPEWVLTCLPNLQELDLSYNRLTGTLPSALATKTMLQEVKVEHNQFSGPIPPEWGSMPNLWRLRLQYNHLTGPVPASFSNLTSTLNQLELANNDLEGDLSALADTKLMVVSVHNNPGLCGMVPASVRYASGFNPAGTRLGYPC